MSFRGRGGGGRFSSGGRGRGGSFGRGRGRDSYQDYGPPAEVVEAGIFQHPCEGEMVCKLSNEKIPYFNASIFLENKTAIGKVDEIFGSINGAYFTVKVAEGIVAASYKDGDKFYIDPAKLLPLERFLPKAKGAAPTRGGGRGGRGSRGGGRGLGVRGGRGGGRFGGGRSSGGRFGSPRGGFSRGGGGFRGRSRGRY